MTLLELLNKANQGYSDNFLTEYYDEKTGEPKDGFGDGLARFIVVELSETFDEGIDDDAQIREAARCMTVARDEIESVIQALYR